MQPPVPPPDLGALSPAEFREFHIRVMGYRNDIADLMRRANKLAFLCDKHYNHILKIEHEQKDAEEKKQLAELKTQFDSTGNAEIIKRIVDTYPNKLDEHQRQFTVKHIHLNSTKVKIVWGGSSYTISVDLLNGNVSCGKKLLGNALVDTLRAMLYNISQYTKYSPIL